MIVVSFDGFNAIASEHVKVAWNTKTGRKMAQIDPALMRGVEWIIRGPEIIVGYYNALPSVWWVHGVAPVILAAVVNATMR